MDSKSDKNSPPVLASSGCYKKNTTEQVAWRAFTAHSSEGCEVQDQGTGRSSVWRQHFFWVAVFSSYSHRVENKTISVMSLLTRTLIPFMLSLPSWVNYLPKATSPNTIIIQLRIRISRYEFLRDPNIWSITHLQRIIVKSQIWIQILKILTPQIHHYKNTALWTSTIKWKDISVLQ